MVAHHYRQRKTYATQDFHLLDEKLIFTQDFNILKFTYISE